NRAANLHPGEDADTSSAKLAEVAARSGIEASRAVPLLASLLSISATSTVPAPDMPPPQQKVVTLSLLADLLAGLAMSAPVLMVVEDLHWVDPTTRELLDLIVGQIERLPVLLLVTFRPDIPTPWDGRGHVTLLSLTRLGRRQVETLVAEVAQGRTLPAEVVELIVSKTDGVPLFVEEFTKAVLESGLLHLAGDRYELPGPLPSLAVPSSLQASLVARLDRLAPVREVAQIGAALGREFEFELLAAVSTQSEVQLAAALGELERAELLFPRGAPPHTTWVFKHALIQDAAYETLLKSSRSALHARIIDALRRATEDGRVVEPEVLAHHSIHAGQTTQAITYLRLAAERAARTSANQECIRHARRALHLVEQVPQGRWRDEEQLELLKVLGPALMVTQGWDTAEVRDTYRTARNLAQTLGRQAELFPAMWGLWLASHAGGHAPTARTLLQDLLQMAQQGNSSDLWVQARHAGASTLSTDGHFRPALQHIDACLAVYRPDQHGHQALTYGGHDPAVCVQSMGALNLFILGQLDESRHYSVAANELAKRLGHQPSLAHALWYRAELCQIAGDNVQAASLAEAVHAIAQRYGMSQYLAWAKMLIGSAHVAAGDPAALSQVERGWADLQKLGIAYHLPHRLGLVVQAYAAAGQVDNALRFCHVALDTVERTQERWFEPELLRLQARMLGDMTPRSPEAAEQYLQRSLAVARRQDARFWQLRSAADLARLWLEQGRRQEARDLLGPICTSFAGGLVTAELTAAMALLERSNKGAD
ncbi:MAG: hypothetical protein KIS63_21310, partial [Caldilineales bacterium]|nr:hypothetical protein [Caldilineales bacterium]